MSAQSPTVRTGVTKPFVRGALLPNSFPASLEVARRDENFLRIVQERDHFGDHSPRIGRALKSVIALVQ
jgi:hypothetical protein